jgi:hypothetical protein
MRRGVKVLASWGLVLALILISFPSLLRPQDTPKGDLAGFVFEQDGSTPVAGAIVVVKNVTTGVVTEELRGLGAGLYALGVTSVKGSFNSQDFVGISPEKTARISVALNPYDAAAAAAAATVIKEQWDKGEAFIGKVVRYLPETREAEVMIEVGLIQADDRIHIKGQVTDFYQDMRNLKAYGAKAKRVLSGHTAVLRTPKSCEAGDFVYIVCKRGVPPFFLAPLGIAAIVAGATPLSAIYKDEPVSPYKIK